MKTKKNLFFILFIHKPKDQRLNSQRVTLSQWVMGDRDLK